ncbi:MAG: hypothetical protein JWO38_208 [Gemmataceae bacterium]|nr:hypothetical protein [Gemmataceae bacterium]
MRGARFGRRGAGVAVLGAVLFAGGGCFHTTPGMVGPDGLGVSAVAPGVAHASPPITVPPPGAVPTELGKITLPPYVVEPPDNLLIEVIRYGSFEELDENGNPRLGKDNKPIMQTGAHPLPIQRISGPFQVRPDGTVGLGFWGSVQVSGLSLEQTSEAIRQHLIRSDAFKRIGGETKPENLIVIVDVLAYNSKRYYVITDGGGYGEQVWPFYITGSETVLDALSNIYGLPSVASKRNIWVARRCPQPGHPWQILPIDWVGITQHGITQTNYQVMPGDRIYVKAQRIITIDTALARVISPIERLFGITLLGGSTVNQFKTAAGTGTGTGVVP